VFGINGAEFLVLLVVAVVVVGPERLPRYAEQLAHAVRRFRAFVGDAKERVATELGDDADLASLAQVMSTLRALRTFGGGEARRVSSDG